jgi:hypothetical protein
MLMLNSYSNMIYGSELDHDMPKLLRFLNRFPRSPVFGSGKNLWQLVYNEDVARGEPWRSRVRG